MGLKVDEKQAAYYEKLLKAEGLGAHIGNEKKIFTKKKNHLPSPVYYELCQKLLEEHKFNSPLDKQIFSLHTQAKSSRKIERIIDFKVSRSVIQRKIKKIISDFAQAKGIQQ